MIKDFTFKIQGNRLHNGGVCFGYGDSDPYIVEIGKQYVLTRSPGSKDWESVGSTHYCPSTWELWSFERISALEIKAIAQIEERKPGRYWRKAKAEMLERLHRLEKKAAR